MTKKRERIACFDEDGDDRADHRIGDTSLVVDMPPMADGDYFGSSGDLEKQSSGTL